MADKKQPAKTVGTKKKTVVKRASADAGVASVAKRVFNSKQNIVKTSRERLGLRQWLNLSVAANVILAIVALGLVSNPTTYSDASTGYSVKIPSGWVRSDKYSLFRAIQSGGSGEFYVYGQRNATAGFYDMSQEERDATLTQVADGLNNGDSNQFIPSTLGLSGYKNTTERVLIDEAEAIKTTFTAKLNDASDVEGTHILIIPRNGSFYSVVVFANTDDWSDVKPAAEKALDDFKVVTTN